MQFPQTFYSLRKIDHLRTVLHNLSFVEAFAIGSQLHCSCMLGGSLCRQMAMVGVFLWVGNYLLFNYLIQWKQKSPGPEHGLEVVLRINESDYSIIFNNGYGVFINIVRTSCYAMLCSVM